MAGHDADLTVGVSVEDEGVEAGIRATEAKVSAAMRRIGAMRAEAEIKADASDVDRKIKEAEARLDKWKAKRASATLDVDTKKADSQLKGIETRLKNLATAKHEISAELSERSKRTAAELDKIAKATRNNTDAQHDFKRAAKDSEVALVTWAGKLSDTTVRLGPFTSSIRGAATALVTLAPLILGVAGAAGALVSVVGAGIVGAAGLGGAALTGFGLAAIGIYGALRPLKAQLATITTATKAYQTAVDKYGESSKQAKKAQDQLNSTLNHMSPVARQGFQDLAKLQTGWEKLTSPTRRAALDTLGSGISALDKLMPMLAEHTNTAAQAIAAGLQHAFSSLSSGAGKSTISAIFAGFNNALPSILAGLQSLGAAAGKFFAAFSGGPLKSISKGFMDWATGVNTAAGNTQHLIQIAHETTDAFKSVIGATSAAGKVLFQFFRAGLGPGMGLTNNITQSLNKLATSMSSVGGQQKLTGFFNQAIQSAKLLWGALTPLLGTFVNFANIFAPFADGASKIASGLGKITHAASGIPLVGTALKAAFGYELLRALPVLNKTLPSLATGLGKLSSFVPGPIKAAGAAVVALGALFAGAIGRENAESNAAERNAAAHREQAAAIHAVQSAESAAAGSGLAAKQATLDLAAATNRVTQLQKEGYTHGAQYKQAIIDQAQAAITSTEAHNAYGKTLQAQHKSNIDLIADGKKLLDSSKQQLNEIQHPGKNAGITTGKEAAQQQDLVNKNLERYVQDLARANVSDASRIRLMEGASGIQTKYAESISAVVNAMNKQKTSSAQQAAILGRNSQATLAAAGKAVQQGASQQGVIKILADTTDAKSKLAGLKALLSGVPTATVVSIVAHTTGTATVLALKAVIDGVDPHKVSSVIARTTGAAQVAALRALVAGVDPSKVSKVIATTTGAAEVSALQGLIAGVQSKSVQITTTFVNIGSPAGQTGGAEGGIASHRHAAGAGPGYSRRAIVGEGGGPEWIVNRRSGSAWKTPAAMIANLDRDDYVIPTEPGRQSRGRSLLADVAKDLGLSGYKTSKKPPLAGRRVDLPVPAAYSAGGVSVDLASKRESDARDRYTKREASIHTAQKNLTSARDSLHQAKTKDAKKRAQGKIDKIQATLSQLQGGEEHLYEAWQQDKADLSALNSTNAKIARLDTIQQTDRQLMANASAAGNQPAWAAAKKDRDKVLGQLSQLYHFAQKYAPNASQLAADIASKQAGNVSDQQDTDNSTFGASLSDFISGDPTLKANLGNLAFNLARDTATGADTTGDQSAINTFYSNLIGSGRLTQSQATEAYGDISAPGSSGSSLTSDQQAQLDQINANGGYLAQANAINKAYNDAALGGGDLGPNITINTLHPGDPATLSAVASAAVGGMGYQAARPAVRLSTGL